MTDKKVTVPPLEVSPLIKVIALNSKHWNLSSCMEPSVYLASQMELFNFWGNLRFRSAEEICSAGKDVERTRRKR